MRKFKILIVDDELQNYRQLLTEAFSRWDEFEVNFVTDEHDAVVSLENVDCVIQDLEDVKGKIEGFDLLKAVRQHSPSIPVIVVSELEDASDINHKLTELQIVADDYLSKNDIVSGRELNELRDSIHRALKAHARVENYQGFLVTHGTDTMSWGLAFLQYMLKDLRSNVGITGSQVPLEGFFTMSDAVGNLHTTVYLINRLWPPSHD